MKLPALPQSSWTHARACYILIAIAWIFYAALELMAPVGNAAHYHVSSAPLEALRITIILPIAVAWFLGIRGATAFKAYAGMIEGSPEAGAINLIADGLLLLVTYFVISALLGAIIPFYQHLPGYNGLIILRDHFGSIFSLLTFFVLYRGSDQLHKVVKFNTWTRGTSWVLAAFAVFAIAFVLLFTGNQSASTSSGARNSLALVSANILIVTLILPYLVAWFMGILTCINISKFSMHVKGRLYRQALRDLTKGLWVVIGLSMLIQVLTFSSRYITGMSLGGILLLLYALLIIYALGFLFVRTGARKLSRLEAFQ